MKVREDAVNLPVNELVMGDGRKHVLRNWMARIRIMEQRESLTPRLRAFTRLDLDDEGPKQ